MSERAREGALLNGWSSAWLYTSIKVTSPTSVFLAVNVYISSTRIATWSISRKSELLEVQTTRILMPACCWDLFFHAAFKMKLRTSRSQWRAWKKVKMKATLNLLGFENRSAVGLVSQINLESCLHKNQQETSKETRFNCPLLAGIILPFWMLRHEQEQHSM